MAIDFCLNITITSIGHLEKPVFCGVHLNYSH